MHSSTEPGPSASGHRFGILSSGSGAVIGEIGPGGRLGMRNPRISSELPQDFLGLGQILSFLLDLCGYFGEKVCLLVLQLLLAGTNAFQRLDKLLEGPLLLLRLD
jgi:hypothetical protein